MHWNTYSPAKSNKHDQYSQVLRAQEYARIIKYAYIQPHATQCSFCSIIVKTIMIIVSWAIHNGILVYVNVRIYMYVYMMENILKCISRINFGIESNSVTFNIERMLVDNNVIEIVCSCMQKRFSHTCTISLYTWIYAISLKSHSVEFNWIHLETTMRQKIGRTFNSESYRVEDHFEHFPKLSASTVTFLKMFLYLLGNRPKNRRAWAKLSHSFFF